MSHKYQCLDLFSDWVEEAHRQQELYPLAAPGPETQRRVREVLGFCSGPETPLNVRAEQRWKRDGLVGEEISWSVGYGPRTFAWILKPTEVEGPLPGIVALHDHGAFKFLGKEKIADGLDDPPPFVAEYRETYYGGRAFANALAKEGFVVLTHDTFLWGSRRFPQNVMPDWTQEAFAAFQEPWWTEGGIPYDVGEYNFSAAQHEHVVEKYCNVLGTTMAGVVSHEDRIAVNYLRSRPDVISDRMGCIGLSGGGNRAALLQATVHHLKAAVIVGLMSTYKEDLDKIMSHTWMFYPSGWARYGDWPDLAACRAPSPLLVQYDLEDDLFTVEGMKAAHERIAAHYRDVGHPESYTGEFYPGPHKFDLQMQQSAFAWLRRCLSP